MNLPRLLIVLVCVAALTSGTALLVYHASAGALLSVGEERVPYYFIVGPNPGFDLATDVLRLGRVPPGGRARRAIDIDHPTARLAEISFVGDGHDMLFSIPPRVYLENGTVTVTVVAIPPASADHGEYWGEVVFRFY